MQRERVQQRADPQHALLAAAISAPITSTPASAG